MEEFSYRIILSLVMKDRYSPAPVRYYGKAHVCPTLCWLGMLRFDSFAYNETLAIVLDFNVSLLEFECLLQIWKAHQNIRCLQLLKLTYKSIRNAESTKPSLLLLRQKQKKESSFFFHFSTDSVLMMSTKSHCLWKIFYY